MNKTYLAGYGFNYACARRLEAAIPWLCVFIILIFFIFP